MRTSYYEMTVYCVNHSEGCENTLLVCGEDLLNTKSLHAACVASCGWRFILSDEAGGVMCPVCAEAEWLNCPECGQPFENCWCGEAVWEV